MVVLSLPWALLWPRLSLVLLCCVQAGQNNDGRDEPALPWIKPGELLRTRVNICPLGFNRLVWASIIVHRHRSAAITSDVLRLRNAGVCVCVSVSVNAYARLTWCIL